MFSFLFLTAAALLSASLLGLSNDERRAIGPLGTRAARIRRCRSLEHLLRDMEEELRDALVQLCRRREVSRPDRLCVVLALLDGDDALALEVDLVARDDDGDVVAEHLLELLDPDLDAVEGAAVGDVVDEEGAVGVAVVDGPQGVETLLPGRVPDG